MTLYRTVPAKSKFIQYLICWGKYNVAGPTSLLHTGSYHFLVQWVLHCMDVLIDFQDMSHNCSVLETKRHNARSIWSAGTVLCSSVPSKIKRDKDGRNILLKEKMQIAMIERIKIAPSCRVIRSKLKDWTIVEMSGHQYVLSSTTHLKAWKNKVRIVTMTYMTYFILTLGKQA